MDGIRVFFLLFVVMTAGMYFLYYKRGKNPLLFPGDIYRVRAERAFYFPLGSALTVTVILYIILKLVF